SLGTLRRRLDRAKELLRARLTRRGATLSAGLFAGVLTPSATASVSAVALDRPVSPSVERLAAAGLRGAGVAKAAVALGALVLGGLAAGLGWAAGPPTVVPEAARPVVLLPTAAPVPAAGREW